ncbi:hypothetical protein Y032_0070g444 [Ancylostoma ceylanicum]|uniref:Protein kinase domain-containing protein n=1 Tax=Ancylostoma ceylanicum TaxID=53326 RepID=A0A016TXC4_9BILA|nr:hypothetical protein Y032_0070g444 [Ancylostoma ceylanicum]
MVLPPQLPSKLWKHSKIFTGSAIYTETSNQGTIQLGGQKLTNYGSLQIYVLDFGMCRKFVHEDGTIKKPRPVAAFRGSLRYAPVSCHSKRELCRQDDCESWLYMVIEFTKGGLPWRNTTDMAKVGDEKRAARVSVAAGKRLFGGKSLM